MTFFGDFERRCGEIQILLDWIKTSATGTAADHGSAAPRIDPTIKASVFLILYNLIEGTASAAILAISDAIEASSEPFSSFSQKMQLMTLQNIHMDGSSNAWHSESVRDRTGGDVVRKAITKRSRYFSGNLDYLEIIRIIEKFGVDVPESSDRNSIQYSFSSVRSKRNTLAHGEASFSDVGRNETAEDLIDLFANIRAGLEIVVEATDIFLSIRGFIDAN